MTNSPVILSASKAAAEFTAGTLPPLVEVQDTAVQVTKYLDALQAIAHAGKLSAIDISGTSTVLTVNAAQVSTDALALSKIAGAYQLTVRDTAANLTAALGALENAAKAGHLFSVALTDSGPITLTAASASLHADVLEKISGSAHVVVSDKALHVATYLDALQAIARAGKLSAIDITGTSTVLTVNAEQVSADAQALSKIAGAYRLTVRDTTANLTAALNSLENAAKAGHLFSVVLTDSGPITLTAFSASVHADALEKISGSTHVVVSDAAGQVAKYLDALQAIAHADKLSAIDISGPTVLTVNAGQVGADALALSKIAGPYQLAVRDTVADIGAALNALETAAKAGTLSSIKLTDTGPITLTEVQLTSDADVLAKLPSTYTLNVTHVRAADAASIAATAHVSSFSIIDTAAHVQAHLAQLEALIGGSSASSASTMAFSETPASAPNATLTSITFTDSSPPILSLSESQLSSDESVLNLITSPFELDVTGVLASDVASLLSNPLVQLLSVADTGAKISTIWSELLAADAAGKIGTVTVTSGMAGSSDISDAAFSLYAKFTGSNGLSLGVPYNGATSEFTGAFANFLQNGGIAVPVTIGLDSVNIFPGDLPLLAHALDAGYVSTVIGGPLALCDFSLSDLLAITNPQLVSVASNAVKLSHYETTIVSIAQATAYYAAPISTAIELGNGNINDAAVLCGVITDTAANLQSGLDALATALAGRSLAVSIQLTDDLPSTINVSVAQATNDAIVLNAVTSSYLLSIDGTASQLASLDLSTLTNEKIELTFTNLTHDITVTSTNIFDVNLSRLLVAGDTVTVKAYSSGGNTGTEIDLTGTDGQAHKIIIIGVNPTALDVYNPLDSGTALGAHGAQVTGGVSVVTALGGSGAVAVTDTATNVAANLDALEAVHARLTGIGFTDSGTPTLNLTEAQLTTDHDVVALLSGNYHLALTNVAAADALTLAANTDVSSISISDSAANILADLDQLEHVAKAGKLASFTLTDSGPPILSLSESQLSSDESVLNLITSPFELDVTGVLASDVASLLSNPLVQLLSVADTGAKISTIWSELLAADAAGKIGTVTVTSGMAGSSDISDAAFSLYAKFTGSNGLSLGVPYNGATSEFTGAFANFLQNGGIAVPVTIGLDSVNIFPGDLPLLAHALDAGYVSTVIGGPLALCDFSLSDLLAITNPQLVSVASNAVKLSHYETTIVSIAQATAYYAAPISTAIELGNGNINDAAVLCGVITDTAANLQSGLDALATALAGRSLAVSIQLTDDLPSTINVSVAQATNDAIVLNAVTSSYLLSIDGTASQLASLDLSTLTNEKIELTFTNLTHDITVTSTNIFDVNLSRLLVAGDTVTVKAYSSGGNTGTEIDLTGTDGQAHKIIIIGVNPTALDVYNPLDSGTALGAHGAQVTGGVSVVTALGGSGAVAVTDTATNVAANLDALEAVHARLTGIGFTDSGTPTLNLTEAQLTTDHDVVALLSGNYHLALTNVAAADALTLAANTDVSSISISDSAANILADLDQLEHVAKAGKLASFTLTDSGPPILSLSESQLSSDESVLNLITSPFELDVTGVLASDVASLLSNPLVQLLSVADTGAKISTIWSELLAADAAGKIGTVTVTSGMAGSSDISDAAFSLYAKFTGSNGLSLGVPYNGATSEFTGAFANFLQNGGIAVPVTIGLDSVNIFPGDLPLLAHALDAGYVSTVIGGPLALCDFSLSDLLAITNPQLVSVASNAVKLSHYETTIVSIAQATAYYAAPISTAIELGNGNINDAAVLCGVITDTAANLQSGLDALATALAGRSLAVSIQLTDDLPSTINVSVAQATNDAIVLNAVTSSYLLSIDGTASQLASLDLSTLTNEKIELTFTNLTHDITVTSTNIFDVNLSRLLVAGDTVTVKAYSSGGNTGTEIDLTGTDGQAHKIIIIGVNPTALDVYNPLDSGTALGAHGAQVTGGVSVVTALGGSGAVAVTDTATNVAANLDALEAVHARLTGIGFTDSGTPTLNLTEAQLTTDHDVVALLSGNYHLALTNVAAADALTLAANTDVSSISISDSAANILADLDQLEHVAKAGELAGVTVTSGSIGTLSESQLFADADVIRLIEASSGNAVATAQSADQFDFSASNSALEHGALKSDHVGHADALSGAPIKSSSSAHLTNGLEDLLHRMHHGSETIISPHDQTHAFLHLIDFPFL